MYCRAAASTAVQEQVMGGRVSRPFDLLDAYDADVEAAVRMS